MFKKIVISCAATVILGACISSNVFASDANKALPIHWGSHAYNNTADAFKTGKKFCGNKYRGEKTCIPAMNNTEDALTINAASYDSANAPTGSIVALIGKGSLPSTVFTVVDTTADGKTSTVYSGPANNREGIICSKDATSKITTCTAWK